MQLTAMFAAAVVAESEVPSAAIPVYWHWHQMTSTAAAAVAVVASSFKHKGNLLLPSVSIPKCSSSSLTEDDFGQLATFFLVHFGNELSQD
jgi:hypothetical protein